MRLVFVRYVDYGAQQPQWIDAQLAAATRLANAASQVEAPDMQLALLRLAGPRLEAAMTGSLLLTVWLDFIHLADAVLTQHLYSVERMFADLWRWLTGKLAATIETVRKGAENVAKVLVLHEDGGEGAAHLHPHANEPCRGAPAAPAQCGDGGAHQLGGLREPGGHRP